MMVSGSPWYAALSCLDAVGWPGAVRHPLVVYQPGAARGVWAEGRKLKDKESKT